MMQIQGIIIATIILFSILVMIEAFIVRQRLRSTYWKALALSFSALIVSCIVAATMGFLALSESVLPAMGLPVLWLVWWLFARDDLPKPYSLVFLIIIVLFLLVRFTFGDPVKLWSAGTSISNIILSIILPFVYSLVIIRLLLKRYCSSSNAWSISLITTAATFVLFVFCFVLLVAPFFHGRQGIPIAGFIPVPG